MNFFSGFGGFPFGGGHGRDDDDCTISLMQRTWAKSTTPNTMRLCRSRKMPPKNKSKNSIETWLKSTTPIAPPETQSK